MSVLVTCDCDMLLMWGVWMESLVDRQRKGCSAALRTVGVRGSSETERESSEPCVLLFIFLTVYLCIIF